MECSNVIGVPQPEGKDIPPGTPVRYFIDVCCDAGVSLDALREWGPPYSTKVVAWLGTWHICKNFYQIAYEVLTPLNLIPFLEIWGRIGIRAQQAMIDVAHVRKSFDFLRDGIRLALLLAAMTSFLNSLSSTEDVSSATLEDFFHYMESSEDESGNRDATFENYRFVLFDLLFKIDLLKNSMRTNDMAGFNAARIFLMPFCFALHHILYSKRHIQEVFQLYERIRLEVFIDRATFFSFSCKGFDEV